MSIRELVDGVFNAANPHVLYAIGISLVVSKRYFLAALLGFAASLLLFAHGLLYGDTDAAAVGGLFTIIGAGILVWTRRLPKNKEAGEADEA